MRCSSSLELNSSKIVAQVRSILEKYRLDEGLLQEALEKAKCAVAELVDYVQHMTNYYSRNFGWSVTEVFCRDEVFELPCISCIKLRLGTIIVKFTHYDPQLGTTLEDVRTYGAELQVDVQERSVLYTVGLIRAPLGGLSWSELPATRLH